ncbi:MAG: polysaccharide deacetylase family protein [Bacteroidetes bacterium]|nr:polysaccharide deacetylase family protein [Bacteroidota bacterium]
MNLKEILADVYYTPKRFLSNLIDEPLVILIYHRVINLKNDPQMLAVKPDNFYRQIEYLKKNFNLLTVEEFDNLINNKNKFPKKSLLITFDDGYADNFINALPILESVDAQALFFITTSYLNTKEEMWWDQLDNIFSNSNKLPKELLIEINDLKYKYDTSTDGNKFKTYHSLHQLIKFNKKNIRDGIIQKLFVWANIEPKSREEYRMLTNEELLSMDQSSSVIIGAHTDTHTPLSILNFDEQLEDIKSSKEKLEDLLKHQVKYFSYPFGNRKDYNQNSVEVCNQIGFNFVCSNFYFQVHQWTNKYELPRALVRNWDFEYFKKQINKFFRY